jgi:hypothetical protein
VIGIGIKGVTNPNGVLSDNLYKYWAEPSEDNPKLYNIPVCLWNIAIGFTFSNFDIIVRTLS